VSADLIIEQSDGTGRIDGAKMVQRAVEMGLGTRSKMAARGSAGAIPPDPNAAAGLAVGVSPLWIDGGITFRFGTLYAKRLHNTAGGRVLAHPRKRDAAHHLPTLKGLHRSAIVEPFQGSSLVVRCFRGARVRDHRLCCCNRFA